MAEQKKAKSADEKEVFVIFKLLDRKEDENSFFLNSNGTKDTSRKLDYTNTYGVLNPYFINNKGVREYRRYILGCSIYDPKEQDKQGFIPSLMNTQVSFEKGADFVISTHKNMPLITWLRNHPNNTKSPYHNPDLHEAVFYEFDPKAVIAEEINNSENQDEAFELVLELKKNESRLMSVKMLFEQTQHLTEPDEVYLGLRQIAMDEPKLFTESIASREKKVLADVLVGFELGVIDKNEKEVFFKNTNARLFDLAGIPQKAANERVAEFLMSKDGEAFHKALLLEIEKQKLENDAAKA